MAPEWARANRPLVIIFTGITFVVTLVFSADVEAQGGAYATGVLVLMSSAALAVAISAWRRATRWVAVLRDRRACSSTRPSPTSSSGPKASRSRRSSSSAIVDHVAGVARAALDRAARARLRARRGRGAVHRGGRPRRVDPDHRQPAGRRIGPRSTRTSCGRRSESHHLPPDDPVLFLEVQPGRRVGVQRGAEGRRASQVGPYRVLRCQSPAIPERDRRAAAATSATGPARSRTSTSAGPKGIRSPTC